MLRGYLSSESAGIQRAIRYWSAREMEAREQESEPIPIMGFIGVVRGVVTQQCNTSPSQVPGDDG